MVIISNKTLICKYFSIPHITPSIYLLYVYTLLKSISYLNNSLSLKKLAGYENCSFFSTLTVDIFEFK